MAIPEDIKQVVAGGLSGAILAFVGVGVFGERVARPDPFTGTEGRELEHRIDALESKVSVITYRLNRKQKELELLKQHMRSHD